VELISLSLGLQDEDLIMYVKFIKEKLQMRMAYGGVFCLQNKKKQSYWSWSAT